MPGFIPLDLSIEVVHYKGETTKKKNILFLGDGFNDADEGFFDLAVRRITKQFFRQAPFNLKWSNEMMEDYFNVFKVFTPSNESGIDVERYIEKISRRPSCNRNTTGGTPNYVHIYKDTALGFRYEVHNGNLFICPKPGFESMIASLLEQLKHPKEETGIRTAIPYCWLHPEQETFLSPDLESPPILDNIILGKDFGLVCVLINDDVHYGHAACFKEPYEYQRYVQCQYVVVALGNRRKFTKIIETGDPIVTDQVNHIPDCPSRMSFKINTSKVLHELGHSHFGLTDEYVNGPLKKSWYAKKEVEHYDLIKEIEQRDRVKEKVINVDSIDEIKIGATNNIDPAKIRWNKILYDGTAQRIIHEDIIDEIRANGPLFEFTKGLNPKGNETYEAVLEEDKPSPLLVQDLLDDYPNKINYVRRIIGLYEGAFYSYKNIYRPAGICRMRAYNDFWEEKKVSNEFCFVCMHWIVSKLIDDLGLDSATVLKKLAEEKDPMWKCRPGV